MNCYSECECTCGAEGVEFDKISSTEASFTISAKQLAHSNMGWFSDLDDLRDNQWPISEDDGVYILWEKDDYCETHNLFHAKALYVGKGLVKKRIYAHAKSKKFSESLLVYFIFLNIENRKAKYVEQLLLDLYDFPLNKAENTGTEIFCAYISQCEADFGTL